MLFHFSVKSKFFVIFFCHILLLGILPYLAYISFMKKFWIITLLLTAGCQTIAVPPEFSYKRIETRDFTLASWQKISNPEAVYKIYIEGDGYAFDAHGYPSANPTPHGTLVRELAFGDPSPNVIYLARPCQYVMSKICAPRHWTTARFAPEIINAEFAAVKQIAGKHQIILVGFSGGAQIAGLISAAKTGLNIKKIITIGGNLDHTSWTAYHNVISLSESLNLENYRKQFMQIPQHHYVGENDTVIPPKLVQNFVMNNSLITIVANASHSEGWQAIYPLIWKEQ